MRILYLSSLFLISTLFFQLKGQDIPAAPANYTPVVDYAGILETSEINALNGQLKKYEKETSTQIVVVAINSLGGATIESYANKLFNEWGIGKRGADNGILLLIAKEDRQMRIELGYGVESYITDAEAARIIDRILKPHFRKFEFAEGIELAVGDLLQLLGVAEFEPVLAERPSSLEFFTSSFSWVWILLLLSGLVQGIVGYFLTKHIEGGFYSFLITTLFVVVGIIFLVIASEERNVLTYVYLPTGLGGLCLLLYGLARLPKKVGVWAGQFFYALFVLIMASLPSLLITAILTALISENGWFILITFIIFTALFFYLFITGKIDISSSGSSSSSSYSSGGSSYSYSDYSSSYSDSSSWGGGSSGGGGASGSW